MATDANVLINLALVDHLAILGGLPGIDFVVPKEAVAEITRPAQRERVEAALGHGYLQEVVLEDEDGLRLFAELRQILGAGESACLALAALRGWLVASDERRAFLREAQRHLGPNRVVDTPGLFVLAIRCGLLTVEQADRAKRRLEEHRFRMRFDSFRELL